MQAATYYYLYGKYIWSGFRGVAILHELSPHFLLQSISNGNADQPSQLNRWTTLMFKTQYTYLPLTKRGIFISEKKINLKRVLWMMMRWYPVARNCLKNVPFIVCHSWLSFCSLFSKKKCVASQIRLIHRIQSRKICDMARNHSEQNTIAYNPLMCTTFSPVPTLHPIPPYQHSPFSSRSFLSLCVWNTFFCFVFCCCFLRNLLDGFSLFVHTKLSALIEMTRNIVWSFTNAQIHKRKNWNIKMEKYKSLIIMQTCIDNLVNP